MDRSGGRDAGKTDGAAASSKTPGRVAGRDSREGSDGGDGGDDGGRQELLSLRTGGRHGSLASHSGAGIFLLHSLILLFSLFIIYFIIHIIQLLDLDPSPNSAMDFYFSLVLCQAQAQTQSTLALTLRPFCGRGPRW
jgi:hypothetical protein